MSDEQFLSCIRAIEEDEKWGLKCIYEAYASMIYSIILNVVKNKENAEDITSEFFIKLWKNASNYQPGNGHRRWLATIAHNMSIDFLRKNNKEYLVDETPEPEDTKDSLEQSIINQLTIKEALEHIEDTEKQIVNMKIMTGMTFKEIAIILKKPLGTITWKYQNAINKLRRCLDD